MNHFLQQLVTEYKKSRIQSEEEVRTKLIIPLLDALGYPSHLRAEDFPVYGYGGRSPLHPKEADFILFKDGDFAKGIPKPISQIRVCYIHGYLIQ